MNDKLVGRSVPRLEDLRFLTGRGRYVADIAVPDALWGHVLRSPHAHAVIKRIDIAAAAKHPGVHGVFRSADLEGLGSLWMGVRPAAVTGRSTRLFSIGWPSYANKVSRPQRGLH